MITTGQSYPGKTSEQHCKASADHSVKDFGTSLPLLQANRDLEWVVNEQLPIPIAYEL